MKNFNSFAAFCLLDILPLIIGETFAHGFDVYTGVSPRVLVPVLPLLLYDCCIGISKIAQYYLDIDKLVFP